MDKETLYKFAINQLTNEAEIEEVVNWIEASKENKREFETLKNLWAMPGFANYDVYAGEGQKPTIVPFRKRLFSMPLLKYAAVFIFAFLIGGMSIYLSGNLWNTETAFNEIIVPNGESAEVYLPDKTHVWLNSGSNLIYPASFDGKIRNVKLTGEAFFDVSHNPKKPFQVRTPRLTVEVLGTEFNVEAYAGSKDENVTLVHGKVNLKNANDELLTELLPGENARFDIKSKSIDITTVNTDFYTSWKEGSLLFKEESLGSIAAMFERWYNVKIVFDDEAIKHLKFTGTILKNKPIDQIFEILKYTAGIEYSIENFNNKPNIIHLKNKPM